MPLSPHRHILPNGLTLIVQENRATPAVSAVISIAAGAVDDPPGREGTAALAARVIDRGSTGLDAAAIADILDARGAALSVSAGRHRLAAACTCLAEDIDEVLVLAARVVITPEFPEHEVVTRRAELVTDLREAEDDPASVAVDRMMAALYEGHPYGRSPHGHVASVERIDAAALRAFHAATFAPAGAAIVLVGDLDAARVVEVVERAFGAWRASARPVLPVPPSPPPGERRLIAVPMMDKAQTDVAYGLTGLARSDPDHDAAWVMNNALGQYAIGGRLGDSIRERQGMAYYVYSRLDATIGAGPLYVRAGVSAANVERTLASIDDEISTVAREGITTRELDESKRYLIGSLPRRLETNAGIAAFLMEAEVFGLGLDYDQVLPGRIAAVTAGDVRAVAARLLDPAHATIVVAGPWAGTAAAGAAS
ncbi:MAG: pitrilysin family protein [Vicinamibacterales bacterium]|nr:pitrilysin family protein [Vicinamibacterales bacterium]